MKAVILAGGVGKRLAPIVTDKCLLRFCGRELVLWQIDALRSVGIEDVVLVCGPGNLEPIRALVGSGAVLAVQEQPTGMAGALLAARPLVAGGPILVVNADDVFEPALYGQVMAAGGRGWDACIAAYEVEEYFPGGYLIVDGDRMTGIVEKPGPGRQPSNLVNIVVHLHRDAAGLFAALDRDGAGGDDVYERAMARMIAAGSQFGVVRYAGYWGPLKFPWHILSVARHFVESGEARVAPTARVHETALITGHVIVEDGARLLPGAVVSGPAYIGRDALIGNNALVRDGSHVGARSVVGYCTELKSSYVGEDCWFHTNYVGDSVVMDGCSMGSGAVTANLRLDERLVAQRIGGDWVETGTNKLGVVMGEGSRLGVQVCTMPGTRVGAGAFVGPAVCLREDLGPGQIVLLKQDTEVREAPKLDAAARQAMLRKLGP